MFSYDGENDFGDSAGNEGDNIDREEVCGSVKEAAEGICGIESDESEELYDGCLPREVDVVGTTHTLDGDIGLPPDVIESDEDGGERSEDDVSHDPLEVESGTCVGSDGCGVVCGVEEGVDHFVDGIESLIFSAMLEEGSDFIETFPQGHD